jgi:hypothetical protein
MNYTNHAQDRLLQRYGLEPSNYVTRLLRSNYKVENTDIVGTETREVKLRYVIREDNIITFLPTYQPIDSIFKLLVDLRQDITKKNKQIENYKKGVSQKDKCIHGLNISNTALLKEVDDKTWEIYEMSRVIKDQERQLKDKNQYNKSLKKKLEKIKPEPSVMIDYIPPEKEETIEEILKPNGHLFTMSPLAALVMLVFIIGALFKI